MRSVTRRECTEAGQVLGRAFERDPLWSVLMPDGDLRCRMFTGVVAMVLAGGGIVDRTEGFGGVAVWLPPGRELGIGAFVRSRFAPLRWVLRTPRRDLKRMMEVPRLIEPKRKALMPEPHWQLMVLGVHPDHHGEGMGSSLVESGIGRAAVGDAPLYVDTSAEANVGFYERFGFELVQTLILTDPTVPFWMMRRSSRIEG
jgi:ribosomal protein S18 acetylase RimI-like enzyme